MKEKTLFFKLLGYILKQKLHFLLDLSLRKEMGLRNDDAVCLSVPVWPPISSSKSTDRFLQNFVLALLHYRLRPNQTFIFPKHSVT